jgi:hypothetical protein
VQAACNPLEKTCFSPRVLREGRVRRFPIIGTFSVRFSNRWKLLVTDFSKHWKLFQGLETAWRFFFFHAAV